MKQEWIRESVRQMQGYVPGEQPARPGLIKLNTNENPYPPAPGVEKALQALDYASLRRYPPPMSMPLRTLAAERHGCQPEEVFFGNGSDEILALCSRAFVENGQRIGYFDPSYSLYPVLAAIRDVSVYEVSLGPDFSWAEPPRDKDIALFFLTNPNAPTGLCFPKATIRAFCASFDGIVLIDEAYADFAAEDCLSLALEFPNVLVSRSLSKSYSLAGLRVGYVVGASPLIGALDKIKDSYNLDAIAQQLALVALQDQAYMQGCVARIRATRAILSEELAARGFAVYPSETNFVWCRPPGGLAAADYMQALRQRGILIRYFPVARLDGYVRISVGTDEDVRRLLEETDLIAGGNRI